MGVGCYEGRRCWLDVDLILGAVLSLVVAALRVFNARTTDLDARIEALEKALLECLDKLG
jgi:hypothetical protein